MNKKLIIHDMHNIKDTATHKKTDIIITNELGEVIFRGSNKVIYPGAEFTAAAHFDIPNFSSITPSYNTALGLDNTTAEAKPANTKERVYLFAVGTDGGGIEPSQKYTVDFTKWIKPDALVPFRYVKSTMDDVDRNVYYGKKTFEDEGMTAYYFKTFTAGPDLHRVYADGSAIDGNIYNIAKSVEAECFVQLALKVNKDECKEWFGNKYSINDARINTISLLTAWPTTINGNVYYQDIRPLTKLNFTQIPLIEPESHADIIYNIYY